MSAFAIGDAGALPHPGTPRFFPAVLTSIRAAAPSLPMDPVVLQAILLCLLAGDKNLILRTREEDMGLVSKLAASVSIHVLCCSFPFHIAFMVHHYLISLT